MSMHHALRNGVVAALLIALLGAAGASARVQPVRRAAVRAFHVAGIGERLWHFLMGFWPQDPRKEGITIDPNGGKDHEGMSIDPNGALNDEGVLIDPNGRT